MPRQILVIDTNATELRKLRELLAREGYSIMTATDVNTAIQICEKVPIAFVLSEASVLGFSNKKKKTR